MNKSTVFARKTLLVMATAGLFAAALLFTGLNNIFPFWPIFGGMIIADTLFHEMGHAIFGWLFGMPAIPSIFTLYGRDQASGVTMMMERTWFMQILSFAGLIYACYRVRRRQRYRHLFWYMVVFTLVIIGTAFTDYYQLPILYMGHGGSIAMGGFFLFRGWKNMSARNTYERWLNAFFGFFLVLYNMRFAYGLATDAWERQEYVNHTIGGAIDNDFVQIENLMWHWSVQGIATVTVAYCAAALILPLVLACWTEDTAEWDGEGM